MRETLFRNKLQLLAFVSLLLILTGCATYPVNVKRGALPTPDCQRRATISVAKFKDIRPVGDKSHIGGVGDGINVVKGGTPIEEVMQTFFDAALKHVGYQIVPADQASRRIEGDVFRWWLDRPPWREYECVIGITMRVVDPATGKILWVKDIQGAENDFLSKENAVRAAVDVTLARAIQEFSSTAFFEAVKQQR